MKNLYLRFIKKNKLQVIIVCIIALLIPCISNTIPFFSQKLLDGILISNNAKSIILFVLSIIILYVLKYLFTAIMQRIVTKINTDMIANMKKEVFNDVINLPLVFHDNNSSQYILSRFNEIDNISSLFSADLINCAIGILAAAASLFLIFSKSILIGFLVVATLPIIFIITTKLFKKMYAQLSEIMEISARTNENIYKY